MADTKYSVTSGFYDAVDNDRLYTADQMNMPYKRLISNGVFAQPDGTASTDFQVLAGDGMVVNVQPGNALCGDKWVENEAAVAVEIAGNTTVNTRIDAIILRVDTNNDSREASIIYRTGTPSASPVGPDLVTTAGIHEFRLANISVGPSASSISQAVIADGRGSADCPWVSTLIWQVDTSTLFDQYNAAYSEQVETYERAYQAQLTRFTAQWNEFFAQLSEDLTVATNILVLRNEYTATGSETEIPIGIEHYDQTTDMLQVYINGLMAQQDVFYTIDEDGEGITLINGINSGDKVFFVVLKSIVTGNSTALMAMVGSPLTANEAADMTDTDKIYVYTGSETGYTAGDWYYFDGSDWADGGVYNSVAVQTDTTLTVSGMAADAKATGDAIAERALVSVSGTKLNITFTT